MANRQPGRPLAFGPSLAMGSASGELPARPSWLNPIGSTQLAEKQKDGTEDDPGHRSTNDEPDEYLSEDALSLPLGALWLTGLVTNCWPCG